MSTIPVNKMMRSSHRNRPTKNILVLSPPFMEDAHHKQMIPPKFVTLPSKRVPMGRRSSNDSSSNTLSNTNTSSRSKVVVEEEEEDDDDNDHLERKPNGRRRHHSRRHSDSQIHSRNPKLRRPSTPDSVASSSIKSQNKLSTNDTYRTTKHSTDKKRENLPPPKPKSSLYTMFFNNNSTTKHPNKKKKTVICEEVDHQYNENGVLRRTTLIRKKRPNGTTATRTHREFIVPTSPKYINSTNTMKRKKKSVRKVEVCVENGQVEK